MSDILIVDDDRDNRDLLVEIFSTRGGYQVATAANFKEGTQRIHDHLARIEDIGLLLTDFSLGDGYGTDLIELLIGSRRPRPFILMSGQTGSGELLLPDWLRWGQFLAKPLELHVIRSAVDGLLSAHPAQ